MGKYRRCAGIIVFNNEGKVLLCARRDHRVSQWQFPQGGVEKGEPPYQAALRELKEETSIQSVRLVFAMPHPLTYNFPPYILKSLQAKGRTNIGQEMYWFLFYFDGQNSEINLKTAHPEFKEYEWADISEAPKRIISFKRIVYKKVCKTFEPRIKAYLETLQQQEGTNNTKKI